MHRIRSVLDSDQMWNEENVYLHMLIRGFYGMCVPDAFVFMCRAEIIKLFGKLPLCKFELLRTLYGMRMNKNKNNNGRTTK